MPYWMRLDSSSSETPKAGLTSSRALKEIVPIDLHVHHVVIDAGHSTDLDMTGEREGGCRLDQTGDLSTREVLGQMSKLSQVNIEIHDIVVPHLLGVNFENLASTVLVWERDLHVHLQTTGTQQRFINHIHVGWSYRSTGCCSSWSTPSSFDSSWLTTLSPTPVPPPPPLPRCLQTASTHQR